MKGVSCVDQLSSVQHVTNIPKSVSRGQTVPVLGNMGCPRGQSQGQNLQRRLHSSLPDLTTSDKVTSYHKWLCTSSQEQLPGRGITCTYAKASNRNGQNSEICRLLQPICLIPQPNNWWRQNNWRMLKSLEKVIPMPRSPHPHFKWWLQKAL